VAISSGIKIVSNQVCYSLIDSRPANEMSAFCKANGIALLCYGAVAGGFLTEAWLGKPEPPKADVNTWSKMKCVHFGVTWCGFGCGTWLWLWLCNCNCHVVADSLQEA
jgi:aryl-alcohol dehydrogenase-like predicted oxidoreductase